MSDISIAPSGVRMNNLPLGIQARYQAELTAKYARLASFDAMLATLITSGLQSYEVRSGDGSRKGQRWSIKEINDEIRYLDGRIRFLEAKVGGGAVMTGRFRRK